MLSGNWSSSGGLTSAVALLQGKALIDKGSKTIEKLEDIFSPIEIKLILQVLSNPLRTTMMNDPAVSGIAPINHKCKNNNLPKAFALVYENKKIAYFVRENFVAKFGLKRPQFTEPLKLGDFFSEQRVSAIKKIASNSFKTAEQNGISPACISTINTECIFRHLPVAIDGVFANGKKKCYFIARSFANIFGLPKPKFKSSDILSKSQIETLAILQRNFDLNDIGKVRLENMLNDAKKIKDISEKLGIEVPAFVNSFIENAGLQNPCRVEKKSDICHKESLIESIKKGEIKPKKLKWIFDEEEIGKINKVLLNPFKTWKALHLAPLDMSEINAKCRRNSLPLVFDRIRRDDLELFFVSHDFAKMFGLKTPIKRSVDPESVFGRDEKKLLEILEKSANIAEFDKSLKSAKHFENKDPYAVVSVGMAIKIKCEKLELPDLLKSFVRKEIARRSDELERKPEKEDLTRNLYLLSELYGGADEILAETRTEYRKRTLEEVEQLISEAEKQKEAYRREFIDARNNHDPVGETAATRKFNRLAIKINHLEKERKEAERELKIVGA